MGAFDLKELGQGPAGRKNEPAESLSGVACQASSVSRSKATASPPSSDGGVSISTARGARPSRSAASKAARTKGSRIREDSV
jgi:hypothetical protein